MLLGQLSQLELLIFIKKKKRYFSNSLFKNLGEYLINFLLPYFPTNYSVCTLTEPIQYVLCHDKSPLPGVNFIYILHK